MPRQPTTWLQVSGHRFLLRRLECALLTGDSRAAPAGGWRRWHWAACWRPSPRPDARCWLCCAPQPALDRAQIVVTRESGALYVRVGDTWHPALNLASARLVAATAADPLPVRESDLARVKRGPLLGIPGAPQLLGRPLSARRIGVDDLRRRRYRCDDGRRRSGAGVVGASPGFRHGRPGHAAVGFAGLPALRRPARGGGPRRRRGAARAPARGPGTAAGVAGVAERRPRGVARSRRRDFAAPATRWPGCPGFRSAACCGSPEPTVTSITRSWPAAFSASAGSRPTSCGSATRGATANTVTVAADVIRAAAIVDTLPVASFPDRAPTLLDGGGDLCATWGPAPSGRSAVALLAGPGLPVPPGHAPVTLSQADGRGPALDAVYLPPGRSAFATGDGPGGTRYLVTETGVRFAVHDDDAARDLGLPAATPAPSADAERAAVRAGAEPGEGVSRPGRRRGSAVTAGWPRRSSRRPPA